jgi:cytochrome subunit of sulfide dehydrogenase
MGCSLLLFASASTAAADMQATEPDPATAVSVQACYGCHARPGTEANGLVSFSASSALEITNKLKAYRSGELSSTVMNRISRGYSLAELESIAAHMAELTANEAPCSR